MNYIPLTIYFYTCVNIFVKANTYKDLPIGRYLNTVSKTIKESKFLAKCHRTRISL